MLQVWFHFMKNEETVKGKWEKKKSCLVNLLLVGTDQKPSLFLWDPLYNPAHQLMLRLKNNRGIRSLHILVKNLISSHPTSFR